MHADLEQLLAVAERQTRAAFDADVEKGARDPLRETAEYSRRRRDYATWLRMDDVPEEARELASRLLTQHRLSPDSDELREFEINITRMLIRLYDHFLAEAERSQGNR